MAQQIRILLAEDSPTVRHALTTIIEEAPDLRVVGEARTGEEAVQLVARLKPDVVSMDWHMPQVDGLEATRQIMATCPTPVVVVTERLAHNGALSMQALDAGALAVVHKPPARNTPDFVPKQRELLRMLRAMARVKVVSRRNYAQWESLPPDVQRLPPSIELLALAASSGGPSALCALLEQLPAELPIPVVITQHMPTEFLPGLVDWLDAGTALPVRLAQQNQRLLPGQVVVAPGDAHLRLWRSQSGLRVWLDSACGPYRYQPSADVLFASVAQVCGAGALGVVLTGMGDDGAEGLLAMREAGAYTLAQDERSSAVFGMPRAALERGAVQQVDALHNLPSQILKVVYNETGA